MEYNILALVSSKTMSLYLMWFCDILAVLSKIFENWVYSGLDYAYSYGWIWKWDSPTLHLDTN